jgi:hypothetical protein
MKIGRGTRERARILTYRRANLTKRAVLTAEDGGFPVTRLLAAAGFITYAKAHSKKSVSS